MTDVTQLALKMLDDLAYVPPEARDARRRIVVDRIVELARAESAGEVQALRARVAEDVATIERQEDEIARLRARVAELEHSISENKDISAIFGSAAKQWEARALAAEARLSALEEPPVVPEGAWIRRDMSDTCWEWHCLGDITDTELAVFHQAIAWTLRNNKRPLHATDPKPEACTCPKVCDCESPETEPALVSNLCPVHNLHPDPDDECPVHGDGKGGEK